MTKQGSAVRDLDGQIAVAARRESLSWWPVAILLGLFCGAFLLLWPTTKSLVTTWEDVVLTTYTHGYLVVAISAWLLFRDRDLFTRLADRAVPLACVPLAVLSLIWLICVRAGIQLGHEVLLPVLLWLAVLAAMGFRIARAAAFAIAYLYFAIPVWGWLTGILQDATALVVDLMLRVTGVTAYVQGRIVHLAVGTFEIAGGCSGLHFFIVGVAIGVLYGEIYRDSWRNRALLVLLAVGLALVTNWLRVYLIILAGYLTDMQHYLVRVEHYRFGWMLFAAMMIVYFLIARRLPSRDVVPGQPSDGVKGSGLQGRWPVACAITLAALALGPAWNVVAPVSAAALPESDSLLPRAAGAWTGPQVSADPWHPRFVGADVEYRKSYVNGPVRVEAFAAAYATQAQKKELVGYGNSFVNEGTDQIESIRQVESRGPVVELQLTDASGQRSLIWYFYRIDTLQTGSDLLAQVSYGASSLAKSPVASVMALRTRCEAECESARNTLQELLRSLQI